MIRRILAALRGPKPWPETWCRVVALHMRGLEDGTGYRRTIKTEELP